MYNHVIILIFEKKIIVYINSRKEAIAYFAYTVMDAYV